MKFLQNFVLFAVSSPKTLLGSQKRRLTKGLRANVQIPANIKKESILPGLGVLVGFSKINNMAVPAEVA
jgi:hypothetical protein